MFRQRRRLLIGRVRAWPHVETQLLPRGRGSRVQGLMNRLHRWYCRSSFWKRKVEREVLPWSLSGVDLGEEVLEVGPGPGLTTDWLRDQCQNIACIEIDPELAGSLSHRMANTNVNVQCGDATAMPFPDQAFSGVVSFTMLHHIPSPALQDRLFTEVYRVLRPGGLFAGTDSTQSILMRIFHIRDTMVLVDPGTLPARLEAVGFKGVKIAIGAGRFRFLARRPSEMVS